MSMLDHSRDVTQSALFYLGRSEDDLRPATLFRLLSGASDIMPMRDLEPPLGWFIRHADPVKDAETLRFILQTAFQDRSWAMARRGGYLLDLLNYYGPMRDEWQGALTWLDDLPDALPKQLDLVPFFPQDPRNNPLDAMARRWKLSAGVLYDRISRLLSPPYVC